MKTQISKILTTTAVAWLLASSVQAQNPGGRSRADVQAEAIAAAHAKDQNVTRGSRGAEPFNSTSDSQVVSRQARETAHAKDQNVTRGSRGAEAFTPMADSAAVRRQAEAAASAPDQNINSGSRVNSKVISTMPNPVETRADRSAPGEQAR